MGWFPARDKDNRVMPGTLNFPQPDKETGNIIKIKRGSNVRTGGNSQGKRRSAYGSAMKALAENAIARGWLNGVPLRKGKSQ